MRSRTNNKPLRQTSPFLALYLPLPFFRYKNDILKHVSSVYVCRQGHTECTHCPLLTRVQCSPSVLQHTHCGDTGELQRVLDRTACASIPGVRDTSCKSGVTTAFPETSFKVRGFFAFLLSTWSCRLRSGGRNQINHICQLLTCHHLKLLLIYIAFVSTPFPHS